MIILKGKLEVKNELGVMVQENKELQIKMLYRKVNEYSLLKCDEKEEGNIITLISEKAIGKNAGDFLEETLHFFQTNTPKMSLENIKELLENIFSEQDLDVITLYTKILDEIDYSGIMKKGVASAIGKKLITSMEEMVVKMSETTPSEKEEKENTDLQTV